jgi:hypothetical protein
MPIRPTLAPLIFAFLTIAVASGPTTALAAVEQPGGVTPRLPVAATTLSIVLKPTPRPTSGH